MSRDVEKGEKQHKNKLLMAELEKHQKGYHGKLFKSLKGKSFVGGLRR